MKPDVYCIEDANGNIEKTRSAATMKTGEHYWCIQPSIESENHGDINFVEPWYGVLTISESGSMLLSRVGKIYPEGDDDENATAFITNENQLYCRNQGGSLHQGIPSRRSDYAIRRAARRLHDGCGLADRRQRPGQEVQRAAADPPGGDVGRDFAIDRAPQDAPGGAARAFATVGRR